MFSVTDTTHVDGTADLVFSAIADPELQLHYDGKTFASIETRSPGPLAKGSRFRGQLRGLGMLEYEYSEFEPGQLLEQLASTPVGLARHRFALMPSGEGTRVAQTISLVPNLLGQLLWPLIIERMMKERVQSLNDRLRTYVHATAPQHLR